jgi:hypothetical protein
VTVKDLWVVVIFKSLVVQITPIFSFRGSKQARDAKMHLRISKTNRVSELASQGIADLLELNYAPKEGTETPAGGGEAQPGAEELGGEIAAAEAPPTEPPAETPPTEEETPPA